mgnify:CR=1 FL=1
MVGLITKLKDCGAEGLANTLNLDKEIALQAVRWVQNETGVDLYKAGPNGENLSATELSQLKDIDLKFNLKFNPKITTSKVDIAIKAVGPLSGFIIVMFCIMLDSYIIYTIMKAANIIQGIENLNAFITLVTGYYHAKAGEIVSYWFGASQSQQIPQGIQNQQNIAPAIVPTPVIPTPIADPVIVPPVESLPQDPNLTDENIK